MNTMRTRVHFTWPDGTEDNVVLSGTIEEIRATAKAVMVARRATNGWSEILSE